MTLIECGPTTCVWKAVYNNRAKTTGFDMRATAAANSLVRPCFSCSGFPHFYPSPDEACAAYISKDGASYEEGRLVGPDGEPVSLIIVGK